MAVALTVSASACTDDDENGVQGVVGALTRAKYELSVLTLNIQGVNESWNGTSLPWRDRYGRIVQWTTDSGTRLDLIVLEEVWLRLRYFAGGLSPFEYETLFELVTRLNERPGADYRIAYASSARTSLGLHTLFSGQAVIYNATRLRNATAQTLGAGETLIPWSDEAVVGPHMRQSYPCAEPRPEQLQLCALIDTDGFLTSPFTNASGRWDLVATASAFLLRDDPDPRILVHNVHVNFNDYAGSFSSMRDLLEASKTRTGSRPYLYSPLVVGDFNVGPAAMDIETSPDGRLADFAIAGFVESDVIGALIGRQEAYAPRFGSPVISSRALPKEERTNGLCAPPDVLWSDHCGLHVLLVPPTQPS